MRLDIVCLAASIAGALSLSEVHSQIATSPTTRAATGAFVQTADGNWRTTIAASAGRPEREFVFEPPTKVSPDVVVATALDASGPRPVVRYRYQIGNGATARQSLARVFIGTRQVMTVDRIPDGWQYFQPQRVGNVSLAGPMKDGVPSGIPPGGLPVYVELSGPVLPGVVTLRSAGDSRGDVVVPEGLTEAQYRELSELSRQATVDIPSIGPAIPAGLNEPELGFDVLAARIKLHYVGALRRYAHPKATDLTRLMEAVAVEGASLSDPAVRQALEEMQRLASAPTPDPFHQQLGTALALCSKALLTGDFPVR